MFRRTGSILLIAATLTCCAGCETRVVKVDNSWVGSQYEMAEKRYPEPKPPQPDYLKQTGHFLFGWTDDLFGEKKTAPRIVGQQVGEISGSQLNNRQSSPTQSNGSGG